MDFKILLQDASKEEGAGQYVLFDDYEKFLGQYHTIDEVKASIKEHDLNWPMLVDLDVLEDRSYIFIGGHGFMSSKIVRYKFVYRPVVKIMLENMHDPSVKPVGQREPLRFRPYRINHWIGVPLSITVKEKQLSLPLSTNR